MVDPTQQNELNSWAIQVIPRAVVYARKLLRNPSDAEDIVQDSLVRLFRKAGDYDILNDGVRILFRTITNLCINATTRQREIASLTMGDDFAELPLVDRLQFLPEEIAVGSELSERIEEILATLPPLQRAAVELRALGNTKQEIAQILQISETNAGVLVYRARTTLAKELEPYLQPHMSEK
ncbi:MAG: RNA polymerase sigma factor [Zavarzinella sp.]